LHIEANAVGLGQRVQVNPVEAEEIVAGKLPQRRHGRSFNSIQKFIKLFSIKEVLEVFIKEHFKRFNKQYFKEINY